MKLIESKAELLQQPNGLEGVYKQIELCGRTCYKSEDKITEDSAKGFVERMIKSNHTAMLEHGTVYLKIVGAYQDKEDRCIFPSGRAVSTAMYPWLNTPYCKINTVLNKEYPNTYDAYITTNLRYIWERELGDMQGIHNEFLIHMCEPTEFHEKRYTFKLTTDRGVMAEATRHRAFSFAVESTRYCNYSKSKFGGEITFIIPSWLNSVQEGKYQRTYNLDGSLKMTSFGYIGAQETFLDSINRAEKYYFTLLDQGWTPQEARQVLPNALKTEICMTGFESDWKHFLDLRYFEVTGKAHPDMKELATKIVEQFKNNNIKIGEI